MWLYIAVGVLVVLVLVVIIVCALQHGRRALPTPFKIQGLGVLPREENACAVQLNRIIGPQTIVAVRQYGQWARGTHSVKQTHEYVPSTDMLFEELLQTLRDGTAQRHGYYLAMYTGEASKHETNVQASLRDLIQLNEAERMVQCDWSSARDIKPLRLWIGPPGHVEQLHYDTYANIHFQLRGTKTWRLFPPHSDLHPVSICDCGIHGGWNFSRVQLTAVSADIETPSHGLPQCALADELCITVQPGEAIYLPAGWWHQVAGSGDDYTVSVNMFEPASLRTIGVSCSWMVLRMRLAECLDCLHHAWHKARGVELHVGMPPHVASEDVS